MALSSGTILSTELNTEFDAQRTAMNANAAAAAKPFQYELEVKGLTNTTNQGLRTLDFTAPDDLEVMLFALTSYSASNVPNTTATLTGIALDAEGQVVTTLTYMSDLTVSLTIDQNAAENNTRTGFTTVSSTRFWLVKGATYRIQISSDSATATTRTVALLLVKATRRA